MRVHKKTQDFYQISLKLILKNNVGQILILKAVDDGSFAGFYDLPGGRVDTDEFRTDLMEVVKREVREEIGNVKFIVKGKPVAVGRHLLLKKSGSRQKDVHVLYVFFEAEYLGGETEISREHESYQWVRLQEIELDKFFTFGILEGVKMYLKK
ncbi:MAG: NUDIX domain-containing protein [Patescibacteria group bacterium]